MFPYTHIFRGQESEAVAGLPDLSLPSKQSQKATGMDNLSVDGAYKKLAKKSDFDCNSMSSVGFGEGQGQLGNVSLLNSVRTFLWIMVAGDTTNSKLSENDGVKTKT